MKGKGWNSWPDITNDQIRSKMQGLPQGTAVAVMTYASDLFSWYAGSVDADVYFCPERQGTYYGGFYIKDAPAIGHEGYSIDEQLTATAGAALCDSSKGYVTAEQAAVMSSLVDTQRNNLYAGTTNIVQVRTEIATLLRSLLTSTASSDSVKAQVLALSGTYGDLDGENNYDYATVFAQVYRLADQPTRRPSSRPCGKSIMSGTYADGTPFDYSVCTTPFLYSSPINGPSRPRALPRQHGRPVLRALKEDSDPCATSRLALLPASAGVSRSRGSCGSGGLGRGLRLHHRRAAACGALRRQTSCSAHPPRRSIKASVSPPTRAGR